jgi:tripartite-type tricarboxylate transporter receptor subunit TctC
MRLAALHEPGRGTSRQRPMLELCSVLKNSEHSRPAPPDLRPLAVTTSMRSEALPDIPTVGDFVAGYETSVWFGVGAPRNTPSEIVNRLNKEINAGLTDPKIKSRFGELGGTTLSGSPADFSKLIVEETEKWAKVIKFADIKAE